jgi:hypothetical protein
MINWGLKFGCKGIGITTKKSLKNLFFCRNNQLNIELGSTQLGVQGERNNEFSIFVTLPLRYATNRSN